MKRLVGVPSDLWISLAATCMLRRHQKPWSTLQLSLRRLTTAFAWQDTCRSGMASFYFGFSVPGEATQAHEEPVVVVEPPIADAAPAVEVDIPPEALATPAEAVQEVEIRPGATFTLRVSSEVPSKKCCLQASCHSHHIPTTSLQHADR